MKKKLMVLLALSCVGLQTNLQAKWHQEVYEYLCLIRWILAEKMSIPPNSIRIVKGTSSRIKVLDVPLHEEDVAQLLLN